MVKESYTIVVRDREWEVYPGTHRIHYLCAHGIEHVIAWSDWNLVEEIPAHPTCRDIVFPCGHMEIIGGCHDVHTHESHRQPQKRKE